MVPDAACSGGPILSPQSTFEMAMDPFSKRWLICGVRCEGGDFRIRFTGSEVPSVKKSASL